MYKNPPQMSGHLIFLLLFWFRYWAPTMTLLTDGALTDPPAARDSSKRVRMTDAGLGGVVRVPPNKNHGYADSLAQ